MKNLAKNNSNSIAVVILLRLLQFSSFSLKFFYFSLRSLLLQRGPKILISFITVLSLGAFTAQAVDTNAWYVYSSQNGEHSFEVKFPTDWKAQNISSTEHGFLPANQFETEPEIMIQEFKKQNIAEVLEHYRTTDNQLLNTEDKLIKSSKGDLIAKEAQYTNFTALLVKRGQDIISFKSTENSPIFQGITQSLAFTDQWHQYIDFGQQYALIFPHGSDLNITSNGVEITKSDKILLHVSKLAEAPELKSAEKLSFHGYNAQSYEEEGQQHILITEQEQYYRLTFSNQPEVPEMLKSIEFFTISDLEEGYSTYIHFPDVRNNHPNAIAINDLKTDKVIDGYPDGEFKPDGLISRAELTKLVVATRTTPNPDRYANCFPDVEEQWHARYICYAKNLNWVKGYPDGTFKPNDKVSRVEALQIIMVSLVHQRIEAETNDLPADIVPTAWYLEKFAFAYKNELLDLQHFDNNLYLPNGDITRKEVAETIYRISQQL